MRHLKLSAVLALLLAPAVARAAGGVATVASEEGSVELIDASGADIAARPPVALPEGARVKTGADGVAVLVIDNGSKFRVAPNSVFVFEKMDARGSAVSLLTGGLTCWARKFLMGRRLRVRVPGAVASVRGTVFGAGAAADASYFDLYQGEIAVSDAFGRTTILSPNQRANVTPAKGLSGTSSLPPGTRPPSEPVVASAAKAAPPKAAAPPSAAEAPTTVQVPPDQSDAAPAQAPGLQGQSPEQQLSVVSPSAP